MKVQKRLTNTPTVPSAMLGKTRARAYKIPKTITDNNRQDVLAETIWVIGANPKNRGAYVTSSGYVRIVSSDIGTDVVAGGWLLCADNGEVFTMSDAAVSETFTVPEYFDYGYSGLFSLKGHDDTTCHMLRGLSRAVLLEDLGDLAADGGAWIVKSTRVDAWPYTVEMATGGISLRMNQAAVVDAATGKVVIGPDDQYRINKDWLPVPAKATTTDEEIF